MIRMIAGEKLLDVTLPWLPGPGYIVAQPAVGSSINVIGGVPAESLA